MKLLVSMLLGAAALLTIQNANAQSRGQHGPDGMQYCAIENTVCRVQPGYYDIAYGARGIYSFKNGVQINGAFNCATSTFNDHDPVPGLQKHCFIRAVPAPRPPTHERGPRGMEYCAVENSVCYIRPGFYDIAYGARGSYEFKNSVRIDGGGFNCATSTFNDHDPIPGVQKHCYISSARRR